MKTKIAAEEKHYQKLNSKLRKELKGFVDSNHVLYEEKYKLIRQVELLEKQLELITKENEFLKSKINLTDEEVQQLVQSSKSLEDLTSMTSILLGSTIPKYL